MKVRKLTTQLGYPAIAVIAAIGVWQSGARAQDGHSAAMSAQHQPSTPEDKARTSALVDKVREATRQFLDPTVAIKAYYFPQFGCVSGSSEGAMGVHFVNDALVGDPEVDPEHPELLVYEPLPNGHLQLVAADYLVTSEAWFGNNNTAPPQLAGQLFHLFESPNRFGLKEFFTLHVWAWKDNPQGTFANWNPKVSCDAYDPDAPILGTKAGQNAPVPALPTLMREPR